MRLVRQPVGSSLCGQCCVAMAAGVSLDRACEVVGHRHGTYTRELVTALRALGVATGDKLKRIRRTAPLLPCRAVVSIVRYGDTGRRAQAHWMLTWDGEVLDPGGSWPDGFKNWRMTSYLEVL